MSRIMRALGSISWGEWMLIALFLVLAIGSHWR